MTGEVFRQTASVGLVMGLGDGACPLASAAEGRGSDDVGSGCGLSDRQTEPRLPSGRCTGDWTRCI